MFKGPKRITRTTILGAISGCVVCGILLAGLWPFQRPRNQVSWFQNGGGLRLGGFATMLSAADIRVPNSQDESSCSIEMCLTPGANRDTTTLLSFSTPDNPVQFSLQQYNALLMLISEVRDDQHRTRTSKVGVDHVLREGRPAFITVSSDNRDTAVYVDGALAQIFPQFPISGRTCSAQLVLGNSPVKSVSWTGELRGLAIYNQELSAAQAAKHYQSWTKKGRLDSAGDEHRVAQYLFEEGAGNVVHNQVHSGTDLYIPERYLIVNQVRLEAPWREYRPTWGYWQDVSINIAGFIPFGCCCYGYLSCMLQNRRVAFAVIALGGTISLTIEILQAFLPTRSSSMTDVITNTLGTSLGVAAWRSEVVQAWFARIGLSWAPKDVAELCREL